MIYIYCLDDRQALKPCGGCGNNVSGVHRCPTCKANMHVFCGTRVGEEGYGQAVICKKCSKDDEENEFDPDIEQTQKSPPRKKAPARNNLCVFSFQL